MVEYLENYTPWIYYLPVSWHPPLKCNTDNGASIHNAGKLTYGFCLRNSAGDLIYAQREDIQECTNIEAEAIAIREERAHRVA